MAERSRPAVKRTYGSRKPLLSSPVGMNGMDEPMTTTDVKAQAASRSTPALKRTYGSQAPRTTTAMDAEPVTPTRHRAASARSSSPATTSRRSTPPTSPGPASSGSVTAMSSTEAKVGSETATRRNASRVATPKGDLRSFFERQSPPKKRARLSPPVRPSMQPSSTSKDSQDCDASSDSVSAIAGPSSSRQGGAVAKPAKLEQLYLDPFKTAGNATLSCSTCALSYSRAPDDLAFHAKHHKKVVNGCDWISSDDASGTSVLETAAEWGKQRGGKILMVDWAVADAAVKRKLKDVLCTIDTELSSTSLTPAQLDKSKIFLFVTPQRKVIACAVVQRITVAYQAVSSSMPQDSQALPGPGRDELVRFGEDEGAIFCSPTPLPTLLGVQRIWTTTTSRRHGLASRLLDCVAARFVYGSPIPPSRRKDDVAFSQPTGKGHKLAKAWTGSETIRVFVE